jgi:hypothetical protein
MSEEQREAFAEAKAAMPAGLDRTSAMDAFQALNARIKAALPLDPASDDAQAFLDERDAMLQPFIALMPPEMKQAAHDLRGKIEQGDLTSPIDAEVDRFYREARKARGAMKDG